MSPDPKDATVAASAVDRNETATAGTLETGRGQPASASVESSFLAPPQQPDEIGRLGNYRILSVLGQGGMGLVFRAEDPSLKRHVAVKVMLPKYATDSQARARFIREARAQAAVEHDHIVAIHSVAEEHNPPFIVMPLLKGMTLAAALKANARPPLNAIVRIGREIAEGLAAAHECGLIHRDIKPANIWLEGSKLRVRILDFGLARAAGEDDPAATGDEPLTADGAVVGTPLYMSPEQARGEHLDARTDLFSLGVILYQMATSRLPFTGKTTASVLLAVVSHEPKGLADANLPPALSAIIERLLTKDRDAAGRPTRAAAIADELKQIEYGLAATVVQVVALDSVPGVQSAPNPFEEIETTAAEIEPVAPRSEPDKFGTKVWLIGGLCSLFLVAGLATAMFKMMTKPEPAVVKDEVPPKAIPKIAPKLKEPPVELPTNLTASERKALAAILAAGGRLSLEVDGQPRELGPADTIPAADVILRNFTLLVDDALLERIRDLPAYGFTTLSFVPGRLIGDDGLATLASSRWASNFAHFNLSGTRATDAGLEHLAKLRSAHCINLTRTTVSEAGVEKLAAALPNCCIDWDGGTIGLDRFAVRLTPEARKSVAWILANNGSVSLVEEGRRLPSLLKGSAIPTRPVSLTGFNYNLTDEAVEKIRDLPPIGATSAWNIGAGVGDAGLATLAVSPWIADAYEIQLTGSQVSDLGLPQLTKFTKLRLVDLRASRVTKTGVEQIAEKMPRCIILYDGGTVGPRFTASNGMDLSGWVGKPGHWKVENGTLIGAYPPQGPRVPTYLSTKRVYRDFTASFQVKLVGDVPNSGFYFRSMPSEKDPFTLIEGRQCELSSLGLGLLITPSGGVGEKTEVKLDEFNTVTVRCVGNRVTFQVNGKITYDRDVEMPAEGVVGFEVYTDQPQKNWQVIFRNIVIEDLSKPEKN